jgi:hypothetical protein
MTTQLTLPNIPTDVKTPDARTRTGFPKVCPIARADPVLAINCDGCEYRQRDQRGYWRCDHVSYQAASGAHFCLDCGVELGPYAEARGWERCGGPQERCLKAGEKSAG